MLLQINELLNQIFTMPLLELKEKMLCGLDVCKLNSMIFLMHAIEFFFLCFDHVYKKKNYIANYLEFFFIQGLLCLILVIGLVLLARFLTLLSFFCTFLTNPLNSYRS